jgi:diguanylate cyclase (GGDEF)-like protein/PAS domain S-box-containing protein
MRGDNALPEVGLDLESQYRSIFENAVEGIYQTTADGRYLRANPSLAQIYGFASPAQLIVGLTDIAGQLYVDPTRRDAFKRVMEEYGIVKDFESQVYRADGSIIWIKENARCVRTLEGRVLYYEGTVEDITQRKLDEERIRLFAAVFDSVADGIVVVDANLTIRAVNPAYEEMTQCRAADLIGRKFDMFAVGFHDEKFIKTIWNEVNAHGRWRGEAMCWRNGADAFEGSLSVSSVKDGAEATSHFVIACSDISVRKRQEQRIWYHTNYDALTQLPNRWLVMDRLQHAMQLAKRHGSGLAVLFLDVNNFKQVNDGLGHRAGDELLQQIAKRLRASVRTSDIVGRFGGDEFLIVAQEVTTNDAASKLVDKISDAFSDLFVIEGHDFYCHPSIGVSYYPTHGDQADTIVRCADIALHQAKQSRDCTFVPFEPGMQNLSAQRLDMENELRLALDRNELILYYQPKVDTQSGHVIAAEALVRWQHPVRGLVAPNEFIPFAEECGLIAAIGEWTIREACEQFLRWRSAGLEISSVSVNLSPLQFLDSALISMIGRILSSTGIEPECLELELTESAMSFDIGKAIGTLEALKALGVRLSIDDFGTGYSSLARLKQLPVDVVKIDRSFIQDLHIDSTAGKIVEAIITLSDVLGFSVVAEGVETADQAAILRLTRCHQLQGYLISRPVNPMDFATMLSCQSKLWPRRRQSLMSAD